MPAETQPQPKPPEEAPPPHEEPAKDGLLLASIVGFGILGLALWVFVIYRLVRLVF